MAHQTPEPSWGKPETPKVPRQRQPHPGDIDLGYVYTQGFTDPSAVPPPPAPPSPPTAQATPKPDIRQLTQLPPGPPTPAPTFRLPGWLVACIVPLAMFSCRAAIKSTVAFNNNQEACIKRGYEGWSRGRTLQSSDRDRYKDGFCY